MPVADLLHRHPHVWARATRHPFLDAVRDGTVPGPAFDAWLVQDHRFLADLLRFQARLLARAPRQAQAVLAGGCTALVEELTWFEHTATARTLDLGGDALPATVAYAALLEQLDGAEAAVALTALWAIERAYLDAWSATMPGAAAYRDFVAHWTTPGFTAYVDALEQIADRAASDRAPIALDDTFVAVADAEAAFWDMTSPDADRSITRAGRAS